MISQSDFIDAIVSTYPSGLTVDDVAIELNHHGISEMIARWRAIRMFKTGSSVNGRLDAECAGFEMWRYVYANDRKGRLSEMLGKIGESTVARFTDGYWTLIVHPSTRKPGKWQLSRLDIHGPYGHNDFDSFEDAVASAIGASKDGWFDRGGVNFTLVETAGARQELTMCH